MISHYIQIQTCSINLKMLKQTFLAAVLIILATSKQAPISPLTLYSTHSQNAFQVKLQMEPDTQIQVYSQRWGSAQKGWFTLNSQGQNINISPSIENEKILYNEKHEGKYHLAYYENIGLSETNNNNRHLHFINTQIEGKKVGYLLPSFAQEARALRTDRLFRCSNTLISIEWVGDDAYIVAMSVHDRWRLVENIEDGFTNEERGVQYGYAVDWGHFHPVMFEITPNGFCMISQDTKPAIINSNWQNQTYDISEILQLVGISLPVNYRKTTINDEL